MFSICNLAVFSGCSDESSKKDLNENKTISIEEPVESTVSSPANRTLGINISENVNGFEDSFQDAMRAGIDVIELNIPWNAIETGKETYEDPWGGVFEATAFYGANDVDVALSIAVINTVKWELPQDIQSSDISHPRVIDRFNNKMLPLMTLRNLYLTVSENKFDRRE